MKIKCPDGSRFQDPDLKGESTVIAKCGFDQYRFSLTNTNGNSIADSISNDRFGCGKSNQTGADSECLFCWLDLQNLNTKICLGIYDPPPPVEVL